MTKEFDVPGCRVLVWFKVFERQNEELYKVCQSSDRFKLYTQILYKITQANIRDSIGQYIMEDTSV